jgi:hypothetical protein
LTRENADTSCLTSQCQRSFGNAGPAPSTLCPKRKQHCVCSRQFCHHHVHRIAIGLHSSVLVSTPLGPVLIGALNSVPTSQHKLVDWPGVLAWNPDERSVSGQSVWRPWVERSWTSRPGLAGGGPRVAACALAAAMCRRLPATMWHHPLACCCCPLCLSGGSVMAQPSNRS